MHSVQTICFFFLLFNVRFNSRGRYETAGRPRHTPDGKVVRETPVEDLESKPGPGRLQLIALAKRASRKELQLHRLPTILIIS